ncbi:MarC family protein [Neptunomonas phycophila]|nr:MarC family protein [Neptunomonas phycophila]
MHADHLIKDALILWATIDPVGTLAIFAGLTARLDQKARFRTALKATLYSAIILISAVLVGQLLLSAMGIRLISLQVAGGIILFLFGLKMIFGNGAGEDPSHAEEGHDIAVFPLAVPSIASPGAIMAAIVLTDNHTHPISDQVGTVMVICLILGITFLFMLAAAPVIRLIGNNGASILIRVMGMLLAALSIELVFEGLNLFNLLQLSS